MVSCTSKTKGFKTCNNTDVCTCSGVGSLRLISVEVSGSEFFWNFHRFIPTYSASLPVRFYYLCVDYMEHKFPLLFSNHVSNRQNIERDILATRVTRLDVLSQIFITSS
jgi:hypothetical protein